MPIILHCLRILKLLQEAVHSYPVRENTFRNSQYSANSPFVIWNSNCISLFCRSISPLLPYVLPLVFNYSSIVPCNEKKPQHFLPELSIHLCFMLNHCLTKPHTAKAK